MPKPLAISFGLPFVDAIAAATKRKVILPGAYYGQAAGRLRMATTTVSGLAALDQMQAVIDSLNLALREGRSLAEWKKEALAKTQAWTLPKGRLETIFRTNVQTAYTAGHWRSFREHSSRRPYLMWSAINDSRVRPTHLAMDGYIAALDDPIWQVWHPPAGYNCRCAQIALTPEQARARGYGGQAQPKEKPDSGFEGGDPGDLLRGARKAVAKRAPKAEPKLQGALQKREVIQTATGPTGPKVSDGLTLGRKAGTDATTDAVRDAVREAVQAIDSVHGDGALPKIPVTVTKMMPGGTHGQYWSNATSAMEIRLNAQSGAGSAVKLTPRLTAAHEIGHYLDHVGWGGVGFSSEVESAALEFRKAVRASPEWQQLRDKRDTLRPGTKMHKHITYLLTTRELWARAYAQYIAVRSGNPAMLRELTGIKQHFLSPYNISQWSSESFEPIAKAIDDLFALLKWRNS